MSLVGFANLADVIRPLACPCGHWRIDHAGGGQGRCNGCDCPKFGRSDPTDPEGGDLTDRIAQALRDAGVVDRDDEVHRFDDSYRPVSEVAAEIAAVVGGDPPTEVGAPPAPEVVSAFADGWMQARWYFGSLNTDDDTNHGAECESVHHAAKCTCDTEDVARAEAEEQARRHYAPAPTPPVALAVGDVVTTTEELDRLPEDALLVSCNDRDGRPSDGSVVRNAGATSRRTSFPLLVLHLPGTDSPAAEDGGA